MIEIKNKQGKILYRFDDKVVKPASMQAIETDLEDMGVEQCKLKIVFNDKRTLFDEVVLPISLTELTEQLDNRLS